MGLKSYEERKRIRTIELVKESPFLSEILTKLRNKSTERASFRKNLARFGRYGGYEISKYLDYKKTRIITGMNIKTDGISNLDSKNMIIIAVLRAAIPMAEGVIKIFPEARLGIISASRGKAPKFEIEMNYIKIPEIREKDTIIILDPMLATGSTLSKVLNKFSYKDMKRMIIFTLISTEKGINKISKEIQKIKSMKEVLHFTGIIDKELNEKGYIIPGLGDAGDRAFG